MKIIGEARVRAAITMADTIAAVERAFAAFERGEAKLFPVALAGGTAADSRVAIKSGLISSEGLLGLKVGTYWPGNPARGLVSHGSTTLLLDDDTGFPRALIAASYLTAMRTAAADAVAVRHLARRDASRVALIGAGHQAWFDLLAICEVRPVLSLRIWSRDGARGETFAARAERELGLDARVVTIEAAVADADIVVTATPSSTALVRDEWIGPGTHISAMGADAPGKQELETALVARASRFADVVAQSTTIGEFEAAVHDGLIDPGTIATIGSVITGTHAGRVGDADITIFDSSGMAIQDLAVSALVLEAVGDDPDLECDFA